MTNSITLSLDQNDGTNRDVIIQAEYDDEKEYGIEHSRSFSIWSGPTIRLGYIMFSKDRKYWKFEGHLSDAEQKQIADFLRSFKENDWEL